MINSPKARQREIREHLTAKRNARLTALANTCGERARRDIFKRWALDLQFIAVVTALVALGFAIFGLEPAAERVQPRLLRGKSGVQVLSMAFSPTSAHIATVNTAGQVAVRAADSGWLGEQVLEYPDYATAVAFSPSGRYLAAVGMGSSLCVWDLSAASVTPTSTTTLPMSRARHVLFAPDGQSLAITTDAAGTILIWDLPAGRKRVVLHQRSPVARIAFSPDGTRLATAGRDEESITLWELGTGTCRVIQEDAPGRVTAIAFSPDGSTLATSTALEHVVRLWDLKTWRIRYVLGHALPVNSLAFSPEGLLLATAGNDGFITLWSVATGERRASVDTQARSLRAVAFSPDGRTIALATLDDDDIRLWNLSEVLARFKTGAHGTRLAANLS